PSWGRRACRRSSWSSFRSSGRATPARAGRRNNRRSVHEAKDAIRSPPSAQGVDEQGQRAGVAVGGATVAALELFVVGGQALGGEAPVQPPRGEVQAVLVGVAGVEEDRA